MTRISFAVPREIARKLSQQKTFALDGSKTPFHCCDMPGQRHPDKTVLSVYLPRTLMQRLRRLAAARGETVQTRDVVLTPEDYEQIAEETRKAQSGRTNSTKSVSGKD